MGTEGHDKRIRKHMPFLLSSHSEILAVGFFWQRRTYRPHIGRRMGGRAFFCYSRFEHHRLWSAGICYHHSRRWYLECPARHQSSEVPCSTFVRPHDGASAVADVELSRRRGMATEHIRCATSLPAGQQKPHSMSTISRSPVSRFNLTMGWNVCRSRMCHHNEKRRGSATRGCGSANPGTISPARPGRFISRTPSKRQRGDPTFQSSTLLNLVHRVRETQPSTDK